MLIQVQQLHCFFPRAFCYSLISNFFYLLLASYVPTSLSRLPSEASCAYILKWFSATFLNTSSTFYLCVALVSKYIKSGFSYLNLSMRSFYTDLSDSKSILLARTNTGTTEMSLGVAFSKNSDFHVRRF